MSESDYTITPQDQPSEASAPAAGESLEQVREILFGSHARSVDEKLQAFEQRVEARITELEEGASRRIDGLKGYIKNELTTLIEKVAAQREERSALFKQLSGEIETRSDLVDKQLGDVILKVAQIETACNEAMDRQGASIADLASRLASESAQLRGEVVERTALAELLSEVARGLTTLPAAPGSELIETVVATHPE